MAEGCHRSQVAYAGSAIHWRVRVQDFFPAAAVGQPDAIVAALFRREIRNDGDRLGPRAAPAHPGEYGVQVIVRDDPLKAFRFAIAGMKRGLLAVQLVQVADERLNAAVVGVFENLPVEGGVEVPFVPLAELLAHEQKLLAGIAPHEAVIGAGRSRIAATRRRASC